MSWKDNTHYNKDKSMQGQNNTYTPLNNLKKKHLRELQRSCNVNTSSKMYVIISKNLI